MKMPWSHKHKILFIHIPKTGGSSIEFAFQMREKELGFQTINKKAMQHFTWEKYKDFNTDIYNNYKKISIVRNPYSRLLSEYYWCEINNMGYNSNQSFDDFIDSVETIVKNKNYNETEYHDHFIPQHEFIYDKMNHSIITDQLFYFENMSEIKKYLQNYKLKLPHKKKNKKQILNINPIQQQKIYMIYKDDFTIFKYNKTYDHKSSVWKKIIDMIRI